MQIIKTENGDICISDFEENPWKDERAQMMRLLDMATRNAQNGNFSFDQNGYILSALEFAEEYACKQDSFNELCWLRETVIRLQWRISNIMKAQTGAPDKKPDTEMPELIPCPRCGAPAVLKYRGYLPDYFCSDEKCGNEGGMAEKKEDAAYNWNSQKARADFKKEVSEVEYKQLPTQELELLAFFLLGEIMKKEGVISERA